MSEHRTHHVIRRAGWAALALLLAGGLTAWAAPAQPEVGPYTIYIPYTQQGANGTGTQPTPTPPPTQPTPTPPPTQQDSGLFLRTDPKTASADVAVDAAGGRHAVYTGYVGYGTLSPAYYAYCAAGAVCTDPANWATVSFGSGTDYFVKAEIRLTAAGHPRLLLYNEYGNRTYMYAACDANCTSPTSWKTLNVLQVQNNIDMDSFDYSYHTFALDPQGRPRFIYEDHYGSIHNGLYYVSCDAGCTDAANWSETNISAGPDYDGDRVQTPDLEFTSAGQPRMITQLYSRDENYPSGVYYITCDQNCEQAANWQRTRLLDRGNGKASWTLALDANDNPRVAIYQGELDAGGKQLSYVTCDADCTDATHWTQTVIDIGAEVGQSPDIALDPQGRPRIAIGIKEDQGIGYLWCNSQCDVSANWQAQNAEPLDALAADFAPPVPFTCDVSTWLGARPQLALGPNGDPFIGYDGEFLVGNNFSCQSTISHRSARFTFFAQP
jgi:hypothetical protein